jgi:hypothetical protein
MKKGRSASFQDIPLKATPPKKRKRRREFFDVRVVNFSSFLLDWFCPRLAKTKKRRKRGKREGRKTSELSALRIR